MRRIISATAFLGTMLFLTSCKTVYVPESQAFVPERARPHDRIMLDLLRKDYRLVESRIPVAPGIKLHAWYLGMTNARFNLVFFRGNWGYMYRHVPVFNRMAETYPVNIFTCDYRGYGESGGRAAVRHLAPDARKALAFFLSKKEWHRGLPVIVVGYSLGGFAASSVATNRAVRGLVLISTFPGFQDIVNYRVAKRVFFLFRPFVRVKRDPGLDLLDLKPGVQARKRPALFIHGTGDQLFPLKMHRKLYRICGASRKGRLILRNAGHGSIMRKPVFIRAIMTKIKDHFFG